MFYVAATRAIDSLECSYAERRLRFGQVQPEMPSRFLEAIPQGLYQFNNSSFIFDERRIEQPRVQPMSAVLVNNRPGKKAPVSYDEFDQRPSYPASSQGTVEFRIGQHVRHKVHGPGKILTISGFGEDMKLTVLFNNGQRLKMMAKFAAFE